MDGAEASWHRFKGLLIYPFRPVKAAGSRPRLKYQNGLSNDSGRQESIENGRDWEL
jgi:hypothetical protein